MARHTLAVIHALRSTAIKLERCSDYQWGHMGSCNCGFLARQITHLQKNEIHACAMQRCGDWNEQLNDYCPTSGLPMDGIITELIAFGFDTDDLKHLERLSDRQIINALPNEAQPLAHNVKSDVIKYLAVWADFLEARFMEDIQLPNLDVIPAEA